MNGMIQKAVDAEIKRLIARGELLLPCVADENLNDNLDCQMKMMTIAVHDGLNIGRKRFKEKVQPAFDAVYQRYMEEKKKVDQEYALSVIDRMYNQIMGEDG